MAGPVILLELNELTPRLMTKWMAEGKLPNFKRFHGEAEVFTTDAGESGEMLNPWVQWVTVHTGLPAAEHGIVNLNDSEKLTCDQIWDVASRAGKKVWVCGSMNPRFKPALDGFVLPDPWSQDVAPFPAGEFEDFYGFVQKNVMENGRGGTAGSALEVARFGAFMVRHGLSKDTVVTTLKQLIDERRTGGHRWRRAAVMDRLLGDVFRWYFARHRPALSTFFLNSTAHFQHHYWRAMEPDTFTIKPSAAELAETGDAILYGYQAMDELLGGFLELAGDDVTLVFSTALSQQPYLKMEEQGGKRHYHLVDGEVLKSKLGITAPHSYEPVMADNFVLRLAPGDIDGVVERLAALRADGEVPIKVSERRADGLYLQCRIRKALARDAVLTGPDGLRVPYYDVFFLVEGLKSGFHHPDGMLWVRHPDRRHAVHPDKISLCAVAPGVLELLGVEPPAQMATRSFLRERSGAAQAVPA